MDADEILEMVKEGTLEPEQVEDFQNLDEEIQELVKDGDLEADEAIDLGV